MWHETAVTRRLGIRYPIIQGPFGGGLSSPRLAATVSNAGGLGSYGAQGMSSDAIASVIAEIRGLTRAPFGVNLWVSTEDEGTTHATAADLDAAVAPLLPFFDELGVPRPSWPPRPWPKFQDQIGAILDARPAVFSFVFGVPPADVLDACRTRGIVTVGAATTVQEAVALDAAGVDAIVATGFEAGGHRPAFLHAPEAMLMGTLSLVPQVVDAVKAPVIAAGGIADGRGLAAALALGAGAAQIGTAFLACEESNAPAPHRDALADAHDTRTVLTRAYSGRLARGMHNRLAEALAHSTALLPYPLQGQVISALRAAALQQGRIDLVTCWSGQSAPLIRHRRAAELFADLVRGAEQAFSARSSARPAPGDTPASASRLDRR